MIDSVKQGGKRPGAGRPAGTGKFKAPTKTMRIPAHMQEAVQTFLLGEGMGETIPFFDLRVQAGYATALADDQTSTPLDLQAYVAPNPKHVFAASVSGDSMIDAGLYEGDIMLVDRVRQPKSGDIVLASLRDEFTVKRLHVNKNTYLLLPENKNCKPIPVLQKEDLHIWGVVTFVIHRVAQ